jgi:hypothetical protein
MTEDRVLISPENIFKIISFEELKTLSVIDNDERTLFFTEIDFLLKDAWTKREKFVKYDLTGKEYLLKDLIEELNSGGYTFNFKNIQENKIIKKFIFIILSH